jgi:hypothetical protein
MAATLPALRARSDDGSARRDRYSTTQLCDDLEQDDGPVCSPFQRIADSDIAGAPSDVRGINAAAHLGKSTRKRACPRYGAAGNGVARRIRIADESRKCPERVKGIEPQRYGRPGVRC